MAKKEITIMRTYNAPRERVWQAWTDAKQVREWFGPRGTSCFDAVIEPLVGGIFSIVMLAGPELGPLAGQKWPMKGTFLELTPPEKLVFSNNALDANSNVLLSGVTSVTFEGEGGKTKMTVVTGAEGTAAGVEQMLGGMEQGWNEQSDKLGEFLAK